MIDKLSTYLQLCSYLNCSERRKTNDVYVSSNTAANTKTYCIIKQEYSWMKKSQIIKNKWTKFSFYLMINAKRIESLSK